VSKTAGSEARRELLGRVGVALFALVTVALVTLVGGAGLLWDDEFNYAAAAREIASGRPGYAFDTYTNYIRVYGFPYLEVHSRGGIQALALAFRAFGASEAAAIVPSALATVLLVLVAHEVARKAGLERRLAALAAALVALSPTVAGFAATAFLEPAETLAVMLGAAAVVSRRSRVRVVLGAAASVLASAYVETGLLVPVALGVAALVRERTGGATLRRSALVAFVESAPALLLAIATVAAFGAWFEGRRHEVIAWAIAQPLLGDDAWREGYGAATNMQPPPVNLTLLLARALKQAPLLVWSWQPVEGTGASILLVHGIAAAAIFGLVRGRSPLVRGLAAFPLFLYAAKLTLLLFLHEAPRLNARHLAPESAGLIVAGVAALAPALPEARRGRGAVLALTVAAVMLGIDLRVATARATRRERLARYTETLGRIAAPGPGRVLVAYNAYRLPWDRPGSFALYPPATEATLAWLDARAPLEKLVLDPWEPLVARTLAETGHPPQRLAGFELGTIDRSLGVSLLVYERRAPR
jgi:hypothetical protein